MKQITERLHEVFSVGKCYKVVRQNPALLKFNIPEYVARNGTMGETTPQPAPHEQTTARLK
jgi:hypothetical protein